MLLARLSLALTSLVFGAFGIWFLVSPEAIMLTGIELTSPSARTEIRAFYGGMEVGLAVFFLLAATRVSWFRPGLIVQAASLGGAFAGRVVGLFADGGWSGLIVALASAEIAGCLLGLVAYGRIRTDARFLPGQGA